MNIVPDISASNPAPVGKILTLRERLANGTLYNIKTAAKASGYCEQHLRRLCQWGRVAHIRRGYNVYFTPDQVNALFQTMRKGRLPRMRE